MVRKEKALSNETYWSTYFDFYNPLDMNFSTMLWKYIQIFHSAQIKNKKIKKFVSDVKKM